MRKMSKGKCKAGKKKDVLTFSAEDAERLARFAYSRFMLVR